MERGALPLTEEDVRFRRSGVAFNMRPAARRAVSLAESPRLFGVDARGRVVFPQVGSRAGRLQIGDSRTLGPDSVRQFVASCSELWEYACQEGVARGMRGTETPDTIQVQGIASQQLHWVCSGETMVFLPPLPEVSANPRPRVADASPPLSVFGGLRWDDAAGYGMARLLLLRRADTVEPTIAGAQWLVSGPAAQLLLALQRHAGKEPTPELGILPSVLNAAALVFAPETQCAVQVKYREWRTFRVPSTRRVHYSQVNQGGYRAGYDDRITVASTALSSESVVQTVHHTIRLDRAGRWSSTFPECADRDVTDVLLQGDDTLVTGFLNGSQRYLCVAQLQRSTAWEFAPPAWVAALCVSAPVGGD